MPALDSGEQHRCYRCDSDDIRELPLMPREAEMYPKMEVFLVVCDYCGLEQNAWGNVIKTVLHEGSSP